MKFTDTSPKFTKVDVFYLILAILVLIVGMLVIFFLFAPPQPVEGVERSTVPPPSPTLTYTHPNGLFTLQYPEGFTATTFSEGNEDAGEGLLFSNVSSGEEFQLFMLPFDEPGPLTAERIGRDLPDMAIESPKAITLNNGTPALSFFTTGSRVGKTYEVWFVHDEILYQATTPAQFEPVLDEVLSTLQFPQ